MLENLYANLTTIIMCIVIFFVGMKLLKKIIKAGIIAGLCAIVYYIVVTGTIKF